jgi:hypothetical protein
VLTVRLGQNLPLFSVIVGLSPLPLLKFAILLSLISELMVTCLDDRMVNTRNGQAGAENAQENGNLPLSPSLAQAITSILESRDEQTELLRQLVANSAHGGNGGKKCSRSNSDHLWRLHGDSPAALHRGRRASRG